MIEPSLRLHVSRARLALILCVLILSPVSSSAEPSTLPDHTSIDNAIERYIRSHPEVIEQSLQALEVRREADERSRQKAALAHRQQDLLNDPASPVSGNLSGTVTLVEFFDYRCGYCKRVAAAVTQLQKDDARVKVVYKDLPILGEASELAAKAALASNIQGKHQAFHEALLATKNEMTKDEVLRIAGEVGLNAKKLDADMANPEWQAIIDRNRALARDLGINGTPGFIVGTELVPGALDVNELKALIGRAGS